MLRETWGPRFALDALVAAWCFGKAAAEPPHSKMFCAGVLVGAGIGMIRDAGGALRAVFGWVETLFSFFAGDEFMGHA
jgi:hypothetical protein